MTTGTSLLLHFFRENSLWNQHQTCISTSCKCPNWESVETVVGLNLKSHFKVVLVIGEPIISDFHLEGDANCALSISFAKKTKKLWILKYTRS